MKTVEQRAKEFVSTWNIRSEAWESVALLLAEQHNMTRLACAENYAKTISQYLAEGECFPLGSISAIDLAIMNTKQV